MHLHFVGIGGIGMSGLAGAFLELECTVSGSDKKETLITKKLCQKGALVYKGHKRCQVEGADLVVFSSAIKRSNPEIQEAKRRGTPLLSRGRLIACIANAKKSVVVAGTHGKTTTTALISELFLNAGKDPTIFIGGILKKINSNSTLGKTDWSVIESDESDGSFLYFRPHIAVITNVENDHLDFYQSPRNIFEAFAQFTRRIKPQGGAVINIDDPVCSRILKTVNSRKVRCLTYGLSPRADVSARNVTLSSAGCCFKLTWKRKVIGEVRLPLLGVHNVYNCLAASSAGFLSGVGGEQMRESFSSFKGINRRMEKVGYIGGVPVFDDYAHHPTEIKAVLEQLEKFGRRVVVIFQPHRYTRTKLLLQQYLTAFSRADLLIITPIYSAGEEPIPGISGKMLFEKVKKKRTSPTYYLCSKRSIPQFIKKNLHQNDLIITLGAGDITEVARKLVTSY